MSPDAPPCDVVDVVLLAAVDFGRVVLVDEPRVVVVVDDLDVEPRAVVVVVDDLVVDLAPGLVVVVVVVDDFVVEPRAVVVVVDDLVVDFGFVVVVVDFGTFGSSLASPSSRAWAGAPAAAGAGGDPGGGGIRSSRRAYCMIRAKTGADTWPP